MKKSYKYRLYPNRDQKILINKTIGSCRWIYNWGLEKTIKEYNENKKRFSRIDLQKEITILKKQTETEWLKEIHTNALRDSLLCLEKSFQYFFNGKTKFPRFKSKYGKKSYAFPIGMKTDFRNQKFYVPSVGWIKTIFDREYEGKMRKATVSVTPSGKYFISILVEDKHEPPQTTQIKSETSIGIDTGIKNFLVLSNGIVVDNPQYLRRSLDRIRILSKRFSKKQDGSKNKNKARIRLAKAYEKVANQRMDYIHKVTHELTKGENQADSIFIEDLNIQGMLANRRLALSLHDSSLGIFYKTLEYKCRWNGINLIKIGRFEPSSKLCTCGIKNDELKLSDRSWTCKHCGATHDRDLLAAQNIKRIGLEKYSGGRYPR